MSSSEESSTRAIAISWPSDMTPKFTEPRVVRRSTIDRDGFGAAERPKYRGSARSWLANSARQSARLGWPGATTMHEGWSTIMWKCSRRRVKDVFPERDTCALTACRDDGPLSGVAPEKSRTADRPIAETARTCSVRNRNSDPAWLSRVNASGGVLHHDLAGLDAVAPFRSISRASPCRAATTPSSCKSVRRSGQARRKTRGRGGHRSLRSAPRSARCRIYGPCAVTHWSCRSLQ